ncbi:hypothetical protein CWI75_10960 [Kineobactrum sediminis]|uniref:Cytochrome c domain-containing protein n=1 Tax=Kineobactrum sediminis TaxID=1905677 RepID=A0A2N5Y1M9_9GAMM|nr:c-type cytochrome [Kineobactrum sediminis]PLW82288.1 hypothetical protein CWI75_10960 [Kineobactrum sediminis]
MRNILFMLVALSVSTFSMARPDWSLELDVTEMAHAEALYQQYCSLCHGEDRSGYRADHAPSLRSHSLLLTAYPGFLFTAIGYGRAGTAMDGYSDEMGGPLDRDDLRLLTRWLLAVEGVEPVKLPDTPVHGDTARGAVIYAAQCASCHGAEGQGDTGPALGDPALLANASDAFLRYAVANGRDDTAMVAFAGEYLLNPDGEEPAFTLREGRYVPAAEVVRALEEKRRFILLDTRPASAWQRK